MAVVCAVVETVRDRDVALLAAGISYYVLVSPVPLLILGVVAATVVGGVDLATRVLDVAGGISCRRGRRWSRRRWRTAPAGGRCRSSAWPSQCGALKLFPGVDVAFARSYGYRTSPIHHQLTDGVVVLVTPGVAALGVVVTTAVIAVVDLPFVGLAGSLVLLSFLVVACLPLYAVIPDVLVPLRSAVPGALFSAVGWTGLGAVFSIYARIVTGVTGALGGVLLLVTRFDVSGIPVLTGAAVNAVLADRVGASTRRADADGRRPTAGGSSRRRPRAGPATAGTETGRYNSRGAEVPTGR
ncbi:hypothetical protein GCM10008995_26820 [Halobellus salinus]|uniref:Uncharacterized protein n=1 Tax=Halobellus salinus TaxID=931585 RepID=A0A830EIS1_9EURY|nr:YihY/virulence factor BrkB family protein [Halobellus salinus]GGJ15624.1 hypothetical protein GCM10008995_26820 [Halobellus salinus]SMP32997.1 membrane protein [Halobellus salinus]